MRFHICLFVLLGLLLCPRETQATPTPDDVALGQQALRLIGKSAATPSQEWVFKCARAGMLQAIPQLTGDSPADEEQLIAARKTIQTFTTDLQQLLAWPRPAEFTIPYTGIPPIIDGLPDDKVWQHAVTFTTVYPLNQLRSVEEPGTTWRLLWDETHLYALFCCKDPNIIAPKTARDDKVYNYDCVEILLLPDPAQLKYWEIEISPLGTIYDAVNTKRTTAWGAEYDIAASVTGMRVATRVDGTPNQPLDRDTGYSVELAIPVNQLPGTIFAKGASPSTRLHVMLTHFDRDAAGLHTYAFCPLLTWVQNIHNFAPATLVR